MNLVYLTKFILVEEVLDPMPWGIRLPEGGQALVALDNGQVLATGPLDADQDFPVLAPIRTVLSVETTGDLLGLYPIVAVHPAPTIPLADFTPLVSTANTPPANFAFTANSAGAGASYFWGFGDGNLAGGSVVSHVYGLGTYTITLTVVTPSGAASKSGSVIVANPHPTSLTGVYTSTPPAGTTLRWTTPQRAGWNRVTVSRV